VIANELAAGQRHAALVARREATADSDAAIVHQREETALYGLDE
jgi:hypothetical protein